ncbi:MAG: 3-oxoacid CoA-transferase subunit B [Ignavibacteriales bacterium]
MNEEEARIRIARRVAREFQHGDIVNLGVGIPTMTADHIPGGVEVFIHTENGMLGVGPAAPEGKADRDLINAGRQPVTEMPGCCYFDSATSFGMIRGGHVDVTVLGAFEVDQGGNISNWIIPNGKQLGVGGAMDLVCGARKVIIAMLHTTKDGKPKILRECTLPLTAVGEADMVVTELGVFKFEGSLPERNLTLCEVAPGVSPVLIQRLTEAEFRISPDLKSMDI